MADIKQLINDEKYEQIIALKDEIQGKDRFYYLSALLALGRGEECMKEIAEHRQQYWDLDPLLTMSTSFRLRFIRKEFDEAQKDLEIYGNYPYVSQQVEESLRSWPQAIAEARVAANPGSPSLETLLETLAAPKNEAMLLAALNHLRKIGELEDYRALVEEVLVGPYGDAVKTYALMLLSAKGSTHEVSFVKNGRVLRLVPDKIGSPFGLPEYVTLRKKLELMKDTSIAEAAGELLDLHALTAYPERFIAAGDEEPYFQALLALAKSYVDFSTPEVEEGKAKAYFEAILAASKASLLDAQE